MSGWGSPAWRTRPTAPFSGGWPSVAPRAGGWASGWAIGSTSWNLLSRSGFLWLFFRLLPAPTARNLAARIEGKLRTTNREYKLAFPREAFRAAAEAAAPSTFLTGHFHTEEREANGLALPWAFEGRFLVWKQGSVKPLNLPPV
jgi:hypothetical protein